MSGVEDGWCCQDVTSMSRPSGGCHEEEEEGEEGGHGRTRADTGGHRRTQAGDPQPQNLKTPRWTLSEPRTGGPHFWLLANQ